MQLFGGRVARILPAHCQLGGRAEEQGSCRENDNQVDSENSALHRGPRFLIWIGASVSALSPTTECRTITEYRDRPGVSHFSRLVRKRLGSLFHNPRVTSDLVPHIKSAQSWSRP